MKKRKPEQPYDYEKNYRILSKDLGNEYYTTAVVDEFLEGKYDFLELFMYEFCTGMREYNGKEIDDEFYVSFFAQERYLYDTDEMFHKKDSNQFEINYMPCVTMTTMKQLLGSIIWYDPEFEEDSLGAIIMETVKDHLEEILSGKHLFLKLKKIFCIKAQSSNDRYSRGYGEAHTLYVTHICITGR